MIKVQQLNLNCKWMNRTKWYGVGFLLFFPAVLFQILIHSLSYSYRAQFATQYVENTNTFLIIAARNVSKSHFIRALVNLNHEHQVSNAKEWREKNELDTQCYGDNETQATQHATMITLSGTHDSRHNMLIQVYYKFWVVWCGIVFSLVFNRIGYAFDRIFSNYLH